MKNYIYIIISALIISILTNMTLTSQFDPPCVNEFPCTSLTWTYEMMNIEIYRNLSCIPDDPCPVQIFYWKRSGYGFTNTMNEKFNIESIKVSLKMLYSIKID